MCVDVFYNLYDLIEVLKIIAFLVNLMKFTRILDCLCESLDPPPTFLLNRAIETYGKCQCLRDARELFDEMPHRDGGSWNAMISAYAQGGSSNETLSLFLNMTRSDFSPSDVTFGRI